MYKPKMVLFDYGHTLLSEPAYNRLSGQKAVMKYVTRNPQKLTSEQVAQLSADLFHGICTKVLEASADLHNLNFQKLLYEYLQIEFSIRYEEIEQVFWKGCSYGAKMPNIETLLDYLHKQNIRTGVISNIGFSGNALTSRINRLLPDNRFEFIIASSEYIVRKPSPIIFELALRKANLPADEVWFCGDDTRCDVDGAHSAGIYPVWYHSLIPNDFRDKQLDPKSNCEHLYINDWLELIDVLEGLG